MADSVEIPKSKPKPSQQERERKILEENDPDSLFKKVERELYGDPNSSDSSKADGLEEEVLQGSDNP